MLTKREIVLPWGHPADPGGRPNTTDESISARTTFQMRTSPSRGLSCGKLGPCPLGVIMLNTSSANCLVGCTLEWNMVGSLKILDYGLKENVMSVQVSFNGILLNILRK